MVEGIDMAKNPVPSVLKKQLREHGFTKEQIDGAYTLPPRFLSEGGQKSMVVRVIIPDKD